MYQSNSFYASEGNKKSAFFPRVSCVFEILADSTYFHHCDEQEKMAHPTETIAFIRCTRGQGKINTENGKFILHENECLFVCFHDIKEYKSLSNLWGYRWVNFLLKKSTDEFLLNKIYSIPFSENEDKAFCKLLLSGLSDIKNINYINTLFLSYFYSIMLENEMQSTEVQMNTNKRMIDEMCSYINQKLYSKISVDEISSFFKISPRRLHQIFTAQLQISPKKYILKKKMEEGYKLLVQTSSPINKIAEMLCFSSAYHFTNEFKKTFGQSPTEVRKMEQ